MSAEGLDVRDERPGCVVFEGGVGCGLSGAALIEEDATVVLWVEVTSAV